MHNRRRRLFIATGLSWALLVSAFFILAEPYGYMNSNDWFNFWLWIFVPPIIFFFIFYIFNWATKEDVNDLKNEVAKKPLPNETPLTKTLKTKKTPKDLIAAFIANNSRPFFKICLDNTFCEDSITKPMSIGGTFAWAILVLSLKRNNKYSSDLKKITRIVLSWQYHSLIKYESKENQLLMGTLSAPSGLPNVGFGELDNINNGIFEFSNMHYFNPEMRSKCETVIDLTLRNIKTNSNNPFLPIIKTIFFKNSSRKLEIKNKLKDGVTDDALHQAFLEACNRCLFDAEKLVSQIPPDGKIDVEKNNSDEFRLLNTAELVLDNFLSRIIKDKPCDLIYKPVDKSTLSDRQKRNLIFLPDDVYQLTHVLPDGTFRLLEFELKEGEHNPPSIIPQYLNQKSATQYSLAMAMIAGIRKDPDFFVEATKAKLLINKLNKKLEDLIDCSDDHFVRLRLLYRIRSQKSPILSDDEVLKIKSVVIKVAGKISKQSSSPLLPLYSAIWLPSWSYSEYCYSEKDESVIKKNIKDWSERFEPMIKADLKLLGENYEPL
jgi:hypothetical protein